MDIFGTVVNAVQLTKDLKALFNGIAGAPTVVRRVGSRVEDVGLLLSEVQGRLGAAPSQQHAVLVPLLGNVHSHLESVTQALGKYLGEDGRVKFRGRIGVLWNSDEFQEIGRAIDHDILILTMISSLLVSVSQQSLTDKLADLNISSVGDNALTKAEVDIFAAAVKKAESSSVMLQQICVQFMEVVNKFAVGNTGSASSLLIESPNASEGFISAAGIEEKRRDLLKSLASSDLPGPQNDLDKLSEVTCPGTCDWIFSTPEFEAWVSSTTTSLFHLTGSMGSGKTILTTNVISRKRKTLLVPIRENDPELVLFYFCRRSERSAESATLMMKTILHQLVERHPNLFRAVFEKTDILEGRGTGPKAQWSLESMWRLFVALLRHCQHDTIYWFIDGLDECDNDSIETFLKHLRRFTSVATADDTTTTFKVFISSRHPHPSIPSALDKIPTVERIHITPETTETDVEKALSRRLDDLVDLEQTERQEIFDKLSNKVSGMFLWADLAVAELGKSDELDPEELIERADRLPGGLQGIYGISMDRILQLSTEKLDLIRRVLTWVLTAKRSLTVQELSTALSIRLHDKALPKRGRDQRLGTFIARYLNAFIEISHTSQQPNLRGLKTSTSAPGDNRLGQLSEKTKANLNVSTAIVRLIHESAREFLVDFVGHSSLTSSWPGSGVVGPEAHCHLAETCLAYLHCEEFNCGWQGPKTNQGESPMWYLLDDNTNSALQPWLSNHPFLLYSVSNLGFHIRRVNKFQDSKLLSLFQGFFSSGTPNMELFWQIYFSADHGNLSFDPPSAIIITGPSHAAAIFLASNLLVALFSSPENRYRIDDVDQCGWTQLFYVTIGPFREVDEGTEESLRVVRDFFRDKDANFTYSSPYDLDTLLTIPLFTCGAEITPLLEPLLEQPATPWIVCSNGYEESLLHIAVLVKSRKVMERVAMSPNQDIQAQDSDGNTPLHQAVKSRWYPDDIHPFFLRNGGDVSVENIVGSTPLHLAAERGTVAWVAVLLASGACVHARDRWGHTPLHRAATSGSVHAFALILAYSLRHGFCPRNSAYRDGASVQNHTCCRDTEELGTTAFLDKIRSGGHLTDDDFAHEFQEIFDTSRASHGFFEVLLDCPQRPTWLRDRLISLFWIGTRALVGLQQLLTSNHMGTNTPVKVAIESECGEVLQHLISTCPDIGFDCLSTGFTTVFDTWHSKSTSKIPQLVQKCPKLLEESVTAFGWTPIHVAAGHGEVERLQVFLDLNEGDAGCLAITADPTQRRPKTPLHFSLECKNLETANFILSKGIPISRLEVPANPLLLIAAKHGAASIMARILDAGEKLRSEERVREGIWSAALAGSLNCMMLLQLHGRGDPLGSFWETACELEEGPPLLDWCIQSQPETTLSVRSMLPFWVVAVDPSSSGENPLGTWQTIQGFFAAHVKDAGEALIGTPAPDSTYPIHAAARSGRKELLEAFLAVEPFPAKRTKESETILHLAALSGSTHVVEVALKAIPDLVNAAKEDGRTALHLSAMANNVEILAKLRDHGASLQMKDDFGRTALHAAAEKMAVAALEFLVQAGVDIDETDDHGLTALHICSYQLSNYHAVEVLIRLGAKSKKDANGWTPLDFACNYPSCVREKLRRNFPKEASSVGYPSLNGWDLSLGSAQIVLSFDGDEVSLLVSAEVPNIVEGHFRGETIFGLDDSESTAKLHKVFAKHPVPLDSDHYYFEVDVLEHDLPGTSGIDVGVGSALERNDEFHFGNWGEVDNAYGYGSANGNFIGGSEFGAFVGRSADRYGVGDTVGCGVLRLATRRQVYFTKNGKFLGVAFHQAWGQLYPMVVLNAPGAKVRGRFGVKPFVSVERDICSCCECMAGQGPKTKPE